MPFLGQSGTFVSKIPKVENLHDADTIYFTKGNELLFSHYQVEQKIRLHLNGGDYAHALVMLYVSKGELNVSGERMLQSNILKGKAAIFLTRAASIDLLNTGRDIAELSCVFVGVDHLEDLLPPAHPYLVTPESKGIYGCSEYICAKAVELKVSELLNLDRSNFVGKIVERAKILELLAEQLYQLEKGPKTLTIAQGDVSKIEEVKQIIENNPHQNYRIAELAKIAGTNEQYLKSNFKLLYGTTVFKYMLAIKMSKSKALMATQKLSISEIAQTVGYKHHTHFTHAFKKHFGFLPKQLKAER